MGTTAAQRAELAVGPQWVQAGKQVIDLGYGNLKTFRNKSSYVSFLWL